MKPIYFLGLLLFIFSAPLYAQTADTTNYSKDSLKTKPVVDTVKRIDSAKAALAQKAAFIFKNRLLNIDAEPVSLAV